MKLYEAIIIFNPIIKEDKIDASVAKIEKKIKDTGGTDINITKWGMKKLASRVKKLKNSTEGNYVLITFNGESKTPNEIKALLNVSEEVARYSVMIARQHKPPIIEDKVEIEPSILKEGEAT